MPLILFALAILVGDPGISWQGSTNQPSPASDRSMLRIVAVDLSAAGRKTPATEPPAAAPDTLYQLRVRIRNSGSDPASDLAFQVTVNGHRLASYVNHIFHTDLAPGKETEVQLYNLWSSESGRPFPPDGRLAVEVRLTGARWIGATKEPTEVQPLPAPFVVTLSSRRASVSR